MNAHVFMCLLHVCVAVWKVPGTFYVNEQLEHLMFEVREESWFLFSCVGIKVFIFRFVAFRWKCAGAAICVLEWRIWWISAGGETDCECGSTSRNCSQVDRAARRALRVRICDWQCCCVR